MDEPTPTVDSHSISPQQFRRTRIAISVFFGALTVAILLLCVRSRTYIDVAGSVLRSGYTLSVTSSRGKLEFSREKLPSVQSGNEGFATYSMYLPRFDHETTSIPYKIGWKSTRQGLRLTVPTWIFAVCSAALACAFWCGGAIPCRFSLRTMLVATTILAVVLGLAAWLAR